MTAMLASVIGVHASGAYAQEAQEDAIVQPGPATSDTSIEALPDPVETLIADAPAPAPVSLAEMVARHSSQDTLSQELSCLASAIYFEARGEPLIGQLAVASVVVNRAESGRFPSSYCGVVHQPSQFSFVRGGKMPTIRKNSVAWKRACALAAIADQGLWDSPVPDALFFHATYVKPRWKLQRIAQVNTHIFYR